MSRTALKTHITDYLKSRYPDWVTGGIIEDLAKGYEYSASNSLRRCRELENEGIIEADYYRGVRGEKLVKYRYLLPSTEKDLRSFFEDTGRRRLVKVCVGNNCYMKEVIDPIKV